jgi:hypothetical protein
VQGIGTDRTVRVDLVDRWLRHLYKNLETTRQISIDINEHQGKNLVGMNKNS